MAPCSMCLRARARIFCTSDTNWPILTSEDPSGFQQTAELSARSSPGACRRSLRGSADGVFFLVQIFRGELPIDKPRNSDLQVPGAFVLVVEIVCVLPHIDGEEAVDAPRHGIKGVVGGFNSEFSSA